MSRYVAMQPATLRSSRNYIALEDLRELVLRCDEVGMDNEAVVTVRAASGTILPRIVVQERESEVV